MQLSIMIIWIEQKLARDEARFVSGVPAGRAQHLRHEGGQREVVVGAGAAARGGLHS